MPTARPPSRAKPTRMLRGPRRLDLEEVRRRRRRGAGRRACRTASRARRGRSRRARRPCGRAGRASRRPARRRGCSAAGGRGAGGRTSIASASSTAARCATPLRPVWTAAPPSDVRVDDLVGHGPDDVGPGHEHVARALDHHGEVGDRRRVDRSPGARTEDHRDLRHDAGGEDVAQEDLGIAAQRRDALLDPRAARVVEPDDRRPDLHREIHDLADLLGVRLRQRAAEHREVLAEDEHQPAVDGAVAGDDAVAEDALLVRAEPRRPVGDEGVQLDERVRVEQQLESLTRRELARARAGARPGPVPRPRATPRAAARAGRSVPRWSTRPRVPPLATRGVLAQRRRGRRHHRSAGVGDHARRCREARTGPPAVLPGRQRPVSASSRPPAIRARGDADIHRTVHNSVIVWTTSSGAGIGRAVGFGHFRRPDGSVAPQDLPR